MKFGNYESVPDDNVVDSRTDGESGVEKVDNLTSAEIDAKHFVEGAQILNKRRTRFQKLTHLNKVFPSDIAYNKLVGDRDVESISKQEQVILKQEALIMAMYPSVVDLVNEGEFSLTAAILDAGGHGEKCAKGLSHMIESKINKVIKSKDIKMLHDLIDSNAICAIGFASISYDQIAQMPDRIKQMRKVQGAVKNKIEILLEHEEYAVVVKMIDKFVTQELISQKDADLILDKFNEK